VNKDVYLFDTLDGGDVTQDLAIRDGLESSVYLSLFGGNIKDDGREDNAFNWWGNIGENVQSRKYRSETAYLVSTVSPTPSNLRLIEDAAKRDLAWVISDGVTSELRVVASMPKLNFVKLSVFMEGISPLEFKSNWGDTSEEELQNAVPVPDVLINNGIELSGTGLPNATLVLVRENGDIITVPIGPNGAWSINPYPLDADEVATIYVKTGSGLTSRGRTVIGVAALYYDGTFNYDGSQNYDGIRN
jgi:phage gp46-like protein